MKKISICALALLTAFTMQAQNKKGNLLAGVNFGGSGISFGNSETSYSYIPSTLFKQKNNSFSLSINPNIGFYISDNFVVGGNITINPYTYKYDNSNTGSTTTSQSKYHAIYLGIGPYGRFYFGDNKGKGMPFLQVNTGINFVPGYKYDYTTSTGSNDYTEKYNSYTSWNAEAQLGYEHFINEIIGIQYALGYSYRYYKYTTSVDFVSSGLTDYASSYKNNSGSINFTVGLAIHLSCKKKVKK